MLLIGLVIGVLAKMVMPGGGPSGFIVTILLGLAGSFAAGWFWHEMGWARHGELERILSSVVGAVVLLVAYRAIIGKRRMMHSS